MNILQNIIDENPQMVEDLFHDYGMQGLPVNLKNLSNAVMVHSSENGENPFAQELQAWTEEGFTGYDGVNEYDELFGGKKGKAARQEKRAVRKETRAAKKEARGGSRLGVLVKKVIPGKKKNPTPVERTATSNDALSSGMEQIGTAIAAGYSNTPTPDVDSPLVKTANASNGNANLAGQVSNTASQIGSVMDSATDLVNTVKGGNNDDPSDDNVTRDGKKEGLYNKKPNYLLYGGIAAGAIAVIGLIIFLMKKK